MNTDWQPVLVADIADVARGGSPRPIKKFVTTGADGVNWIKIGDTEKGGRYITKTAEKIIPEGIKRSRWVDEGDFLLSNSMSFGRPYILKTSGCIHDGWLVLKPDYARIDQAYLYYALSSPLTFAQFDAAAAGSTVRNLNIGLVEKVSIPLPPLEEQKRIVAVLDQAFAALDRARTLAEANLADAEELFERIQSTLLEHLSIEAPMEKLGALVAFLNGDRGKNYPSKSEYVASGISWINTGHIKPDGTLSDEKMNFITQAKFDQLGGGKTQYGDIVFCLRGATIGKTALVGRHVPGAVASSLMIIRPSPKVIDKFVYYFLTSELGRNEIERFIGGAAQPNLAGKSVGQFNVPIVSTEKQRELVGQLDIARTNCSRLAGELVDKIAHLDDLRQSLLQKAFAGELT